MCIILLRWYDLVVTKLGETSKILIERHSEIQRHLLKKFAVNKYREYFGLLLIFDIIPLYD